MFGALNRFISRLDSDSPAHGASGHGLFGFQVLRNKDAELPIEPWFDFIVGINGRQIDDPDPHLFAQEVRNCAGGTVTLGLWTAKGQRTRTLPISVPANQPSLALTLQWTPLSSTEDVWHILDVAPNSPADTAGLLPYGDYIIGTPSGLVRGEAGLGELVEDHLSRPLDLQIYNHEYDLTRVLTIHPSRHWGGDGALGCTLGYGALHRLPAPLQEPPHGPGETLFETAPAAPLATPSTVSSSVPEILVPAVQLAGVSPTSAPGHDAASAPDRRARKGRAAGGVSPKRAMDEYFREGEEKSRAVDHAPSSSAVKGGLPPPPPKAGAGGAPPPPRAEDVVEGG
ncbi:MAG: hypothetical protein M1832_002360 [Thelocarpon impressellum]|nr:MAG: hypothetical protein M1832_002360 [Thelocarpon impressellum]